jgi:hypothetical protein
VRKAIGIDVTTGESAAWDAAVATFQQARSDAPASASSTGLKRTWPDSQFGDLRESLAALAALRLGEPQFLRTSRESEHR